MSLEADYKARYDALVKTAKKLEGELTDLLLPDPMIDRIYARAKDPARFLAKAARKGGGGPQVR